MADFSQVKLPDGTTYDVKDSISGYITGITVDSSATTTTNLVTSSSHPYNASTNALATMADVGAAGGGTVTSVGVSNATNGGLTVSGSPVTSSGTISVGHSNVLTNAQTTEGVYPITIDKNGHINSYGSAVNQLFEVIVTMDGQSTTADKTYAQITAAYAANKFVYATLVYDDQQTSYNTTLPLTFYDSYASGSVFFETLSNQGQYVLTLYSDNSWDFDENAFSSPDTKVTQTNATPSSYTYWRPLVVGYSSNSSEGFTPSTVTNTTYTFKTLEVQPSSGTIRAGGLKLYNGSYTSTISDETLTANRTLTVPNKSGTIALTSDMPTVNDGGLKLQKDSGTATSIFTANQSSDSTLKFTTTSVGSASGWSAGTMASIDTSKFTPASLTVSGGGSTVDTASTLSVTFSGGSLASGFYTAGTAPSLTVSSTTVVNDISNV